MAPAGVALQEGGVLVSRAVEGAPARRVGAMVPQVLIGVIVACTVLAAVQRTSPDCPMLAWTCAGGAPASAPVAFMSPTPLLTYVPAGMVPFKQPTPAMRPVMMSGAGKGFGGGEATRDPSPTQIDPNDPKGKQQAIHKAESFADYLKRRGGGGGASEPAETTSTVHEGAGKGFGGGEATRDPAPTQIDPNDPKGKQGAIHKAESFADYLKRREAEGGR